MTVTDLRPSTTEGAKERLRDFSAALQREINIRRGDFGPVGSVEQRWANEGACEPYELETIRNVRAWP